MLDCWIQTYTGRRFYPLAPRMEDIDIEDIAHALSNICRFTGHCREFLSVAQHSVLVCSLASPGNELAALLHDGAEAYIGDIGRPLKQALRGSVVPIEAAILQKIYQRYGIERWDQEEIERLDDGVLMAEARELMGDTSGWSIGAPPADIAVVPWGPREATRAFLRAFDRYARFNQK